MARRRTRHHRGDGGVQTSGFADRIASATKGDPGRKDDAPSEVPAVLGQGLTRYQRRTANLPSGAVGMTDEDRTNIVIDLRHPAEDQ
jgi:hypothetical protein